MYCVCVLKLCVLRFDGTAKFRSDYYFITDNPKYPDARLSIYERFLTSAELGAKQGQTQITVANFDTETTMPSISCLVLRAWFLQRASLNGWIDRKMHGESGMTERLLIYGPRSAASALLGARRGAKGRMT